ncbi:MAG: Rdx family protein, partial [Verrucomicrobiota bacterium]|nr:Rdx family protein [Verrucomicrobiota bacterium]
SHLALHAEKLLYHQIHRTTTFETEIEQVSLRPCKTEAGRFRITLGEQLIWCRKRNGGFPEIKILKQSIRDCIAPQKDLGHSDSKGAG